MSRWRAMKRLLLLAWLGLPLLAAEQIEYTRFCAGCKIWGAATVSSHTGQFVVHGGAARKTPLRQTNTNAPVLIDVEPQMLAVTAERTKRALFQELLLPDAYQDKIHAIVLDLAPLDGPIQLISEVYLDGFQYRLAVPGRTRHTRLIRGLTQALLQEFANRGSRRSAELPNWLVEGMTRQVLSSPVPTYVVNETRASVEIVGMDRLSYTRAYLNTNAPMSIRELSFYDGNPADRERFEACSHLFVHELLKLRGGPALMARFIQSLSGTLNWQTAFYNVYQRQFNGALALEKWWTLAWLDQKNRIAQEVWPLDTALDRLNALLLTSMETRTRTNDLPVRRDVPLQELLATADFSVQRPLLERKIQELYFISLNLPPELAAVAGSYLEAMESYLQKRTVNESQPGLKFEPEQRAHALTRATTGFLDELDLARGEVRAGRPVSRRTLARRGR